MNINWCNFVLNEGIMPAVLARFLKQNNPLQTNTKLLAQILKERAQFNTPSYPEITSLAQKAFLNDDDLNNWLLSMDNILTVIINFSNKDINTTDILNGAFSSFIKSCPLVADNIKKNYLQQSTSLDLPADNTYKTRIKRNLSFTIKKEKFTTYLQSKNYSYTTRNSYCTSVNIGSGFAGKNLWDVEDATEMKKIYNTLQSQPEFQQKNMLTHNGLSCGLLRYIEFLETD